MSFQVSILRSAQKELHPLQKSTRERIIIAIQNLADDPRPANCKKLTAREGWRIRIGNYRVVYEISDAQQTVTILHIGHRRDVYE